MNGLSILGMIISALAVQALVWCGLTMPWEYKQIQRQRTNEMKPWHVESAPMISTIAALLVYVIVLS